MTAARLSATVIVPTRNRGELIVETLRSLLALSYPGLEIAVVDQSTDDRTEHAVRDVAGGDPRVRLQRTETVGVSAGRNLGARSARSDIIAFTDDDCVVAPLWLESLLAEFEDPRIVAVYGRILPFETAQRSGIEAGYKPSLDRAHFSAPVPPWHVGHGGNMAFRRLEFLAMGAFDPVLGAGAPLGACEDIDLTHRLLSAGKRVAYAPDALACHREWKDWQARREMERAYGVGAGAFMAKRLRCGDRHGLAFFAAWVWQLGVRRLGAGLIKWRSGRVMYLGYCQLLYPWIGALKSLGYPIDRTLVVYKPR